MSVEETLLRCLVQSPPIFPSQVPSSPAADEVLKQFRDLFFSTVRAYAKNLSTPWQVAFHETITPELRQQVARATSDVDERFAAEWKLKTEELATRILPPGMPIPVFNQKRFDECLKEEVVRFNKDTEAALLLLEQTAASNQRRHRIAMDILRGPVTYEIDEYGNRRRIN